MQLRTKLAVLVMAGGAAALVLASTPAMASSQTVTETAGGAVYGKAATANNVVIPLTWHGLVNTHGAFSGGGSPPKKGQDHTFTTVAGSLTVLVTARPTQSQGFNLKACHFSFTTHVDFTVLTSKSTGKFAGLSGTGVATLTGGGYVPRLTSGPHKGQCDASNNAPELTNGAVESFQLKADLAK
jgi:hypothetical protein